MMRLWLWALVACVLLAAVPARAQSVNYFYCYAPDAQTGTVYMSQTLPVGPIAERAKYGQEYVAYLRAQGIIKDETQGYCVMRATADQIARGQLALPTEPCAHCLGAKKFTSIHWARNSAPPVPMKQTEAAVKNVTPPKPAAQIPYTPPPQPPSLRIVVMGNDITGEVLVGKGGFNLEQVTADRAVKSFPQTGWQKILASEQPGFGAAMCVDDGKINFFVAHGKDAVGAAFVEALDDAKAYGRKVGKKPFLCKHWYVPTVAEMNTPDVEPVFDLDFVRGLILKLAICESEKDAGCVKRVRASMVCMCVRG